MKYYIYMLRCKNGSIYTGIAKDYIKRYKEHSLGIGAKYTRANKAEKIEIVFEANNRSEASIVESYIKSKKKREKENILAEYKKFIEKIKEIKKIDIFLKK